MAWPCFLVERSGRTRLALRRYADSDLRGRCTGGWWHNAATETGIVDDPQGLIPSVSLGARDGQRKADPRWPTHCKCGYAFQPDDEWQESVQWLYRLPDGREVAEHELPVGAMRIEDGEHRMGREGQHVIVTLPGALHWDVDGPSRQGGLWDRTGTPPNVTASPSILVPGYHGWLRAGVLTDPC